MGRVFATPSRTPPPALGPSHLVSTGVRVTDYRVCNPTNDRFQMWASYMKFTFFPVSENGENGLGHEGADEAMLPPEFVG